MYKALKSQVLAIIWAIVILVLCNMRIPQTDGPKFFFEGFDKMTHLGFFFVFTILLFYGKLHVVKSSTLGLSTIIKIIAIAALLGGGIEILQWKVFTYRSAEWWDFASDMIGCLMGVFSYIVLRLANQNQKV